MKYHVIFDLDGTLIDSSRGIYQSFRKSCKKYGHEVPQYKEFKKYIGPPVQIIAKNILIGLTNEDINQIKKEFRRTYDKYGFRQYEVYDGADRTIKYLSEKENVTISIVTNKPTLLAKKIIAEQGWEKCFRNVIGIDYPQIMNSAVAFENKSIAIKHTIEISQISN